MSIFDKQVDAAKWAIAFACNQCDWKMSKVDKWTIRDCMFPWRACPKCNSSLHIIKKYNCPKCNKAFPIVRFPHNLRITLWGGHYCHDCKVEIDKWGSIIT